MKELNKIIRRYVESIGAAAIAFLVIFSLAGIAGSLPVGKTLRDFLLTWNESYNCLQCLQWFAAALAIPAITRDFLLRSDNLANEKWVRRILYDMTYPISALLFGVVFGIYPNPNRILTIGVILLIPEILLYIGVEIAGDRRRKMSIIKINEKLRENNPEAC